MPKGDGSDAWATPDSQKEVLAKEKAQASTSHNSLPLATNEFSLGFEMEVVTSAAEKVKGFFDNLVHRCEKSYSRNPIEILKRLHRESFSDLMKLRDRLDKVERLLSFYKTSNGSPFREASTHVRGEVDVLGAVLMADNVEPRHVDLLDRAGVRTGIHTRITIETTFWQNDTLVVDLMANQEGNKNISDTSGSPFSLSKLSYAANIGGWFSAIAVPLGAQCRDFDIARNYPHKVKSLTAISSTHPGSAQWWCHWLNGEKIKCCCFIGSVCFWTGNAAGF